MEGENTEDEEEDEKEDEMHVAIKNTVIWVAQLSGPKCKSVAIQIDP